MPNAQSTSEHNILTAILKGELNEFAMGEVRAADAYLEDALDVLDQEEPTLCRWLESDPELSRLLHANITATARMIYRMAQQGVDYNDCMGRVNALFFRVICAAVYHGVQSDRPSALAGLHMAEGESRDPEKD